MHLSRRLFIVPMMLGVILSFAAASFGTQSASAQTSYGAVQNCVPIGSVTSCIVSLNSAGPIQAMLAAGGTWGNGCISTSNSIAVTCSVDSTGTMITISCSGGCPPNAAIQVIVNGGGGTPSVTFALSGGSTTTYAAPTYIAPTYTAPVGSITVGQQQPTYQVTVSNQQQPVYNNGGQCVGGSYPTALGCTSGYVPYFQPIVYQPNNGCVGIWGACGGGCNGFTFGCFNNNTNNCFGGFVNNGCGNNCTGFGFNNNGCGNNCTGFGFNNNGCGNNCTGFGFNNNGCGNFNFPGHCTGFGFNNNGCGNFGNNNHGCVLPQVWHWSTHMCA
jgi:hypothetical protein